MKPGEDALEWEIRRDEAVAHRAVKHDETLIPFLQFVERDIAAHPERLREIPESLYQRLLAVTAGMNVDPDDSIEGSVAL